jgi:hypothetical protein
MMRRAYIDLFRIKKYVTSNNVASIDNAVRYDDEDGIFTAYRTNLFNEEIRQCFLDKLSTQYDAPKYLIDRYINRAQSISRDMCRALARIERCEFDVIDLEADTKKLLILQPNDKGLLRKLTELIDNEELIRRTVSIAKNLRRKIVDERDSEKLATLFTSNVDELIESIIVHTAIDDRTLALLEVENYRN